VQRLLHILNCYFAAKYENITGNFYYYPDWLANPDDNRSSAISLANVTFFLSFMLVDGPGGRVMNVVMAGQLVQQLYPHQSTINIL